MTKEEIIEIIKSNWSMSHDYSHPDDSLQYFDGEWYFPRWGNDTIQTILDEIREKEKP